MEYLKRRLEGEVEKWLDRREIIAIKGPRQSGKTTLLKILKEYLETKRKVDPKTIIYLNFEDRDILENFSKDPKSYVKSFIADKADQKFYFLIDEFQYLEDGGQKIKLLYDIYENIKFIITGSSSLELTAACAKYLVGRLFSFHLYQFSFAEFLQTKEQNIFNNYLEESSKLKNFILNSADLEIRGSIYEKELRQYFEDYATFGGYPEVVKASNTETKKIILKNIYDTYISKDIIELLHIGDISDFRTILKLLSNQIGGLLNYHSLTTDSKSYFKRTKKWLNILEETFVIRQIRPYFKNKTTELKKNPKIYFSDTGLRNYIINNFNTFDIRSDAGLLVENTIFNQIYPQVESIRYWRTLGKAEVDFILELNNNKILPVEIKFSNLNSPEITKSFRNFIEAYQPDKALILTVGYQKKIKINKSTVLFYPCWYM
ncbi:MAG: ATP-binding protein [Candidatus Omnitrophota bacterium]